MTTEPYVRPRKLTKSAGEPIEEVLLRTSNNLVGLKTKATIYWCDRYSL